MSRKRAIKDGEVADYGLTDLPPLPVGWAWAKVHEVGEVKLGRQRSPEHHHGPHMRPYLRVANVYEDRIDLSDVMEMNFTPEEFETYKLQHGDILLNEGQSLEWVGRPAMYRDDLPGACFQNTLVRFRPGPNLIPSFALLVFRYYLHSQRFQKIAKWTVNIAHLGASRFAELEFPLPPKEEQSRIVEKFDELFTRLDAGIVNLGRAKVTLKRYRASVLKAACEGTLVRTEASMAASEGRAYEPASRLIDRVGLPPKPPRYASRSVDLIAGHAALSVGPVEALLPEGWARVPLVDVARMESGHTPSRSHPEWWIGEIPWVGILDAKACHGKSIRDSSQRTNEDGLANSSARLLPAGTVIVSRTAASIGYVTVTERPMATSQDFINWIPTPALTSEWLQVIFMADTEALRRFGKGSVHKTVYYPEWLSMHIAIPPLAEQYRIVSEVHLRISFLERVEIQVEQNLRRASLLKKSILKRAFHGRLVPQDSSESVRKSHPESRPVTTCRNDQSLIGSFTADSAFRKQRSLFPDIDEA